jgi:hypothetical protein
VFREVQVEWLHRDVSRYGHHIRSVSVLEQNSCTPRLSREKETANAMERMYETDLAVPRAQLIPSEGYFSSAPQ